MSPLEPLPTSLGTDFSVSGARATGVARSRLRARDVIRPFHGSRSTEPLTERPRPDETVRQRYARERRDLVRRCRAYVPVAPEGFRFSHVTAARLWDIPIPPRLYGQVELDVEVSAAASPRSAGIIGHRTSRRTEIARRDGLPVTSAVVTWMQLASALTVDELVIAGDHLARRKRPASSTAALTLAVAGAGRMRGVLVARAALRDIRSGTDSPRESQLRLVIVRAGLPEPVIGHTVHDRDGFFVGTPDLAYVAERIAIEYDGEVHRTDPRVFADDIERREQFEEAGWRYTRVTKEHLQRPHAILDRLRRLLAERAVPGAADARR